MTESRKITVNALTRVEGEGALHIRIRNKTLENVRLSIYEPPRFFESFLRGRSVEEIPDITARICGICPVAYQLTSVQAVERALEVTVTPEIRMLRRLLYCAEWIESHVLHIYMLNAPDFFNCHSGIELAQQFPTEITRGLRMKKIGDRVLEVLGGRAIHPVNVRVGGFYRLPTHRDLQDMLPDLQWALTAAIDTTNWVAGFEFPEFLVDCELVALQCLDEYAMSEGKIASTKHAAIDVNDYETNFCERQVEHSTALHAQRRKGGAPYFLGPLARLNLNHQQLFPQARSLAAKFCPAWPIKNRFRSIIARSIEVVHAFEEAISIVESYLPSKVASVEYEHRDGFGCAATEAPRGMIYHSYQTQQDGTVSQAKIVPPTSQNQLQIESDLRQYLPRFLSEPDETIAIECEKLIRAYDPCISCSTHFLKLKVERT